MLKSLKKWFGFPQVEDFKIDAIDRDGDNIVQEGTPFERKVKPVKKTVKKTAPKKKAPVKKVVKKTTPKKNTKKK